MDQGLAVLLGAVVGFSGVGLTVAAQEFRARAQDSRVASERLARTRGMTRMVGSELRWMHRLLKHAPFDEVGGFDRSILSTKAWERYGPDICSDLSLDVVDKLLVAYGAVDTAKRRESEVTEETLADVRQVPRGMEVLEEHRALLTKQREQLLKAIAGGYDALHPFFDLGATPEGDQSQPQESTSSG